MADYREGLHLIPEHMHEGIAMWIEQGEPHPSLHGAFFRALLTNDLMGAFAHADLENRIAMYYWAVFLHTYAPIGSFGSAANVEAWHAARHPETPR